MSGGATPLDPPRLGGVRVPPTPLGAPLDALGSRPPTLIVQYSVALDASTSRPLTSSFPVASRSRAACSPPWKPGGRPSGSARSGLADTVTVLPGADVPVGVQGQAAQRARGPAGGDDLG